MKVLKFIKDNFSKSANLVLLVLGVVVIFGLLAFSSIDVLALIGVDSGVTGTVSAGDLNKGLVGYWPMDGTHFNSSDNRVNDLSGYGNHGTNYGAILATGRMGENNGAMSFDGSNYISVPDTKVTSDVSVSVWIKSDDDFYQGVWQILSDYSRFILGTSGTDSRNMCFIVNPDGVGWQYSTCYTVPSGESQNWHHFVGTRNGSTGQIKIYYDGELKDTQSRASGNLPSSDRDMTIAKREVSASYFDGSLFGAKVWNRVLLEKEIESLYNSYKPKLVSSSLQKGLILDMPLTLDYTKNETMGSEIMTDKTPYGNDGQNYGATIAKGGNYTHFDGVDDYIDLGDVIGDDVGQGNFTISAWINNVNEGSNSEYHQPIVVKSTYGVGDWGFDLVSGNQLRFHWDDTSYYSGFSDLNDGTWHHVTVVKSGDELIFYKDMDKSIKTGVISKTLSNDKNLTIGARIPFSTHRKWKGNLSNIKIYNRALSENEVSDLYDKQKHLVGPDIVTDGLVLYLDSNNPDSLEAGSGDGSTFYNITRDSNATFYTDSTMVDSSKTNRDEWVYFDGSGEYDSDPPGNHIVVDESLTRTDQSADGWTYFWAMKLTGTQPHGQRIFHGASTIRHIEIKNEDTENPSFRTEAATDNGYSFGTGVIPGGSLIGDWNTFAIVWDNSASPRTVKWYKNGELFYTDTNFDDGTGGTGEYFSFNRIGRSGGTADYHYTESLLGYLPVFMSYDRKLSDTEVQANHDAFKDRFGISE